MCTTVLQIREFVAMRGRGLKLRAGQSVSHIKTSIDKTGVHETFVTDLADR
jgi:hypothetical protein